MSKKRSDDAMHDSIEVERERIHRQMLSSISHDLKTPLAAVIGSLEIFTRMGHMLPPEKSTILIQTALSEAYRLDSFVTNILDMAKLENNLVALRVEPTDLESVLRDCTEKFSHRYPDSAIEIAPFFSSVTLQTDPALLARILALLLDNALKYGGHPARVQLAGKRVDNHAIITVSDNGEGIPDDKVEEIFSKYTRLKREDHQNAGTGLGLAIGRGIATMLHGELHAGNHPPKGAMFTLTLPIQ